MILCLRVQILSKKSICDIDPDFLQIGFLGKSVANCKIAIYFFGRKHMKAMVLNLECVLKPSWA